MGNFRRRRAERRSDAPGGVGCGRNFRDIRVQSGEQPEKCGQNWVHRRHRNPTTRQLQRSFASRHARLRVGCLRILDGRRVARKSKRQNKKKTSIQVEREWNRGKKPIDRFCAMHGGLVAHMERKISPERRNHKSRTTNGKEKRQCSIDLRGWIQLNLDKENNICGELHKESSGIRSECSDVCAN